MKSKKQKTPSNWTDKWTTMSMDRKTAKAIKQIALDNDVRTGEALQLILDAYKELKKIKKNAKVMDELENITFE